jgi:hypothetical protein
MNSGKQKRSTAAPRHKRYGAIKAALAIVLAWVLALSGYLISKHSRMTAEKVDRYLHSLNLAHLSSADRLKALKNLAQKVNALSPEERQRWRMDMDWFQQLSDEEKAYFIEAFLPGEMQLALKMFEQWPRERQRQEIDNALRELRAHAANPDAYSHAGLAGSNGPVLSPELDQKVRTMGLNALYSKGSAQTRAELAPLLMEIQRQFESGQLSLSKF